MIYEFKRTARIPAGVSATGVIEERDRIADEYGEGSISNACKAVMKGKGRKYPNLWAFCPKTPEEAFRIQVGESIGYAFRQVVRVDVTVTKADAPPIREFYAVTSPSTGETTYEHFEDVKADPVWKDQTVQLLARDATVFARKMEATLAELGFLA